MSDYTTKQDASAQIQYEHTIREEWELLYRQRKSEPEPPGVHRRWDGQILLFAFIGIAASVFAALRTFPVFQEIGLLTVDDKTANVEGALATVFVDLAVMTFRFVWVRLANKGLEKEARLTGWVKLGWAFAVGTQVIVQFYAVRDIATVFQSWRTGFEVAIAFAAALSSILLAFVVGEIIAVLFMGREGKFQTAQENHAAAMKKYQRAMNAAWTREKGLYGVKKAGSRKESRNSANVPPPANYHGNPRKFRRGQPTPAEQEVIDYLNSHEDAWGLGVVELGERVGYGKSVASEGKKWAEYLRLDETQGVIPIDDALEELQESSQ